MLCKTVNKMIIGARLVWRALDNANFLFDFEKIKYLHFLNLITQFSAKCIYCRFQLNFHG